MATPEAVIDQLRRRGIELQPLGTGDLKIIGASRLTDQEKAALRQHKGLLLRYLQSVDRTKAQNLRRELEAMHPPIVEGVHLSDILDQLSPNYPEDYEDCRNPEVLAAFARSLLQHGEVKPANRSEDLDRFR